MLGNSNWAGWWALLVCFDYSQVSCIAIAQQHLKWCLGSACQSYIKLSKVGDVIMPGTNLSIVGQVLRQKLREWQTSISAFTEKLNFDFIFKPVFKFECYNFFRHRKKWWKDTFLRLSLQCHLNAKRYYNTGEMRSLCFEWSDNSSYIAG